MKRILTILLAALLVLALLLCGLLGARKLLSMYTNLWDRLDKLSASDDAIITEVDAMRGALDALSKQTHTLYTQTDHLHRLYAGTEELSGYDYGWIDQSPPYIAHACGGIDGATYTNSREAFLHNYALGQRVFEIDFNLSDDGTLIASHDEDTWRRMTGSDLAYTAGHFDQLPLLGGYESLSCLEVIELMAAYPDVYVVTDTKATTQEEVMLAFAQLVHCAKKAHPETLDRIIPQIYNEEMLPWISSVYPFRSVILTLYQLRWTPDEILGFCTNSGVRFVTMPDDQVTQDVLRLWDAAGIHVGVHTINDPQRAAALFDMGVDMLYTDFLLPE